VELAKRLGHQTGAAVIQTQFAVVRRSLQNAPLFEEWLEAVLPILLL